MTESPCASITLLRSAIVLNHYLNSNSERQMPPIKTIIKRSLKGVIKAQKHYEYWSGGCWLWEAPEYLVTTYIARQISRIEDADYYVTVEHKVRDAIEDAGGLGRGRPPHALRLDGRFDILLWNGEKPSAVTEVKNQVFSSSQLRSDVARICAVLDPRRAEGIQGGLLAFYTSKYLNGDENGVKRFVADRLDRIEAETRQFVEETGRTWVVGKRSKVKRVEDSAWAAAVFHIGP